MMSRIFWVGIAGMALVTGMVLQDGNWFFGSDRVIDVGIDRAVDRTVDRTVDRATDRAIDRSFDQLQVVGPDGQQIDVPARTKRELAAAVTGLIKAETDLALARIGDANEREVGAANARRDRARADVDRLKAELGGQDQTTPEGRDRIRSEIREDIRATIRDAVGN